MNRRGRLAVATSAAFPDLLEDWPILQGALAGQGIDAVTRVWSDPGVAWGDFDLVLANGAWDNIHHPARFCAWAEQVSRATRLVNPPPVLRWNIDKHYLADLAADGIATVPTTYLAPGQDPGAALGLHREFVVKPTISGGGFESARYGDTGGDRRRATAHVARLHAAGRTAMLQPYLASVDHHGEKGLVFLGGELSHTIAKNPLLVPGAGVRDDLSTDQVITATTATEAEADVARAALAAAGARLGPATYARVDLVELPSATPAVLELELLDPALFFDTDPPAATRFAHVLSGVIFHEHR